MERALSEFREMFSEQVTYRELLLEMTRRDLLLRYKQTIMGFGWAVFMPLLNTAVFSVIFTRVAHIDTGVAYPLFAYLGLLAWHFSASSMRASVTSLTTNGSMVTKIYFPREIFPFSALLVALVDFVVGSSVLVALMGWYGIAPSPEMIWTPVIIAVQAIFTAALALFLAMANLFYRDVKYIFEVGISIWMFATSVLYPLDSVGGTAGLLLRLNPMTHIIDAYRAVLLHAEMPALAFFVTAIVALALLLVSWLTFHRSEFEFAERI